MFKIKPHKNFELWKFYPKKKKTLREITDQNYDVILENLYQDIVLKDYSFLKKKFDLELIKLHLKFNLKNYILPLVINLTRDKEFTLKKYKSEFFLKKIKYDFKFFFKFFYFIIKTIIFLNINKKAQQKKNYPIIVEYFYGLKQKNDFPDINKFGKKDILFLFRYKLQDHFKSVNELKKFTYNYITLNKQNSKYIDYINFDMETISDKTRKYLKQILLLFLIKPKKAFINLFILKFILDYELYHQIFKRFNTKIFVHSLSYDNSFPSIRQALDDCNAVNVNYLRSYFTNKSRSILAQPDEILFVWGKYFENNFHKLSNLNKHLLYSKPYFAKLNKNKKFIKTFIKKANGKKIISLFDTNAIDTSPFSPHDYNSLMEYLLNYVIKNKNTFLIIKFKNSTTKNIFSKRYLLDKLIKQKRAIEIDKPYFDSSSIFHLSKLVVSMNTLSIGAEALYNGRDSLNFVSKSFDKKQFNNFNKIYDFVSIDLKDFAKKFDLKIKSKVNYKKLFKLKKYIFKNSEKTNSSNFIKFFIKKSKENFSKEKIIKNYKKNILLNRS